MIILLPDGSAKADTPSFSFDNEFEREQTSIPGDWNTIDTITQQYSFDWAETYSSRLKVDLGFELQFEDVIRSLDVDEKTVEPSLDLSLGSLVWDLSLYAQDTIEYTNEFNSPRKDAIEYGIELDLLPFYLPTFKFEAQRILDTQEDLEDKIEEKIDANMEYELGDNINMSISWKEETTDDRLFDDSDIDSHDWEITFDYGQTMTPVLKVDFQSDWSGSREDTLNNAGQILNSDREHLIDNNLKFNLDTYPNFDSELELGHLSDFVEDGTETVIDFSAGYDQPIVELGTLTETFTITRERVDLTSEDTTSLDIDFDIELAGTPYKYLDYSIKYTISLSDLEDGLNPASSTDTQEDEIDFSATITPNEKATVESSFNWSTSKERGVKSGSSRDVKLEGTFEGEMFDVPNLVFAPLLEVSEEKDFVTDETTDILNLELEFTYSFVLPPSAFWELVTTYAWEKEEEITRELEFTSDFSIELFLPSWEIQFEEASSTTIEYDTDEPTVWEHEFNVTVGKDLTPVIRFDSSYTYEYDGGDANSDEVEIDLEWEYRNAFLSLSYSNDRVFENPRDVERVYTVEVSMDF